MKPQVRSWGSLVLLLTVFGHSDASGAISTIEAKLVLEQESILAGGIVTGFVEFVNRSGRDLVVSNGPYEYSGNWRLTVTGADGKAVEVGNPDTKIGSPGFVFKDKEVLWKPLVLCRFYGVDIFPEHGTYSITASAVFRCADTSGTDVVVRVDTEPVAVLVKPGGCGREAFRYNVGDIVHIALRYGVDYSEEVAVLCCDYGEDYRAFAAYGGAYGVLLYIWSQGRGWPEGRSSEVGFFDDIGVTIEGKQRFAAAAGAGMWMWEEIQANWQQLVELPQKDDVKGPINVRIGRLLVY